MFLEGVIIVWPAIYGTIIGAISLGIILGLILYFLRLRIKKKAVLFIKKKNYSQAIELFNKIKKSRMLTKIEISEVNTLLAVTYLLMSDYDNFLGGMSNVTYKKHLTLKSFWEAIYYLEVNDIEKYHKTKEEITKNYNANFKMVYEKSDTLERYILVLEALEENEKTEKISVIYKMIPDQKVFLKEYLSKYL